MQSLPFQLRPREGEPCCIALRPGNTGDKPGTDRIADAGKNDGDCAGRLLGSERTGGAGRHDDVGLHADQLGRQLRESIIPSFRPSVLDGDVLALNTAEFAQLLPECV